MHEGIVYIGLLDDEMIELDVAALQLSALDHPGLELAPYRDLLGTIAVRAAELGQHAYSAIERAELLAHVIGGEYGFVGDAAGYDAPINADLIRVIDRRKGLPVSLSILFVSAARRIGWTAEAMNVPGHVLVAIGDETPPLLIDPFAGGGQVAFERLAAILSRQAGPRGRPSVADFAPMSNREVLIRLLLNQASRAEQQADTARAAVLYARMTVIAPGYPQGWWDLARLQLVGGEIAAARASLGAMLEITRNAEWRERISATLEAIAGEYRG